LAAFFSVSLQRAPRGEPASSMATSSSSRSAVQELQATYGLRPPPEDAEPQQKQAYMKVRANVILCCLLSVCMFSSVVSEAGRYKDSHVIPCS
jgi:ABC-type dipeptide/oligopeptide/nickel transport system permease component